jgi:hypothetical protein
LLGFCRASPPPPSSKTQAGQGPVDVAAICAALALLAPAATLNTAVLALTAFFLNCGVWKAMAAVRRPRPIRLEPVPSGRLPTYTVLVPLYRERQWSPTS